MSDKRYHIFISTAFNGVEAERLKLEYTLLNLGGFPWQFNEPRNSLNTAQARRQMDECDYVIFVLDDEYGELSASGISYLHLDFLYAVNKQKPILSFMSSKTSTEKDPEIIKKRQGFVDLLKSESEYFQEYSSLLDFERQVRNIFQKAKTEYPVLGWVRPKSNDVLQNEIVRLREKVADLEQSLIRTRQEASFSQSDQNEQQKFNLHYRTQAYQDGNLKDITPQIELTWLEALKILAPHFKQPTLEMNFIKVMNNYLEGIALEEARKVMPRVHAVSRTHVDTRSLQQLKLQMKWNNWIIPQSDIGSGTRVYWRLTADAERVLNKINVNMSRQR